MTFGSHFEDVEIRQHHAFLAMAPVSVSVCPRNRPALFRESSERNQRISSEASSFSLRNFRILAANFQPSTSSLGQAGEGVRLR